MIKTFINAWKVKDIRSKMLYTLLLIVVYRLGSFIPVPSVDTTKLEAIMESATQYDFLNFLDLFSGGSLSQFSLFAMGISPYITASIIMQLLAIAIPALERLSKEEDGQKKIEKITRIVGVVLALVQSISIVVGLQSISNGQSLLKEITLFGTSGFGKFMNGFAPYLVTGICCTAGTAFLMWMGERITEKGIGNGVSMLIFASIVSSVPAVVKDIIVGTFRLGIPSTGDLAYSWWYSIAVIVIVLIMVVGIVMVEKAVRRIPVQYAKRVVGRKLYGGQSTHIPLKANANGVMPLIFAMTILQVPAMISQFWPNSGFYKFVSTYLSASSNNPVGLVVYYVIYALLIVGFAYFYSSITFNPVEISKNLQQNGGFITGIRPGRPTSDYLQRKSSRLTMFGAIFLMLVAIVPTVLLKVLDIKVLRAFGPTSILIMISVSLEVADQLDSLMLARTYKGFLN
ncbi:MAG: preprotein translocase subunit SecY [Clostridia bacterium]|nr:preprotein translocase subunit SecY [Clostridia bacterium]